MNAQNLNNTALLESRGLKHFDANIERLEREIALMKELREEYRSSNGYNGKARALRDLLEFSRNYVSSDPDDIWEIARSLKQIGEENKEGA